jgi:hypothetical protein
MTTRTPDTTIANVAEAERAIANLNVVLDRLMEIVEEETVRVRAGKLCEAAELGQTKAELSHRYAIESEHLMAVRALIASTLPDAFDALRKRNAAFQVLLQTNLTVLATAHAVSEGIIRGISGELARKRAPSTYSASGRANKPAPKISQPLAVSRML